MSDVPEKAPEPSPRPAPEVLIHAEQRWSGMLPHPSDLRAYRDIDPRIVDSLVSAFERQQAHRMEMERRELEIQEGVFRNAYVAQRRGQWMALTLAAFFGVIGAWLAWTGHDTVAGIVFTTTIIALVGAFIANKAAQARQPESTDSENESER
jgi:uncharacterized membrane protein